MDLSRRQFVGCVAGGMLPLSRWSPRSRHSPVAVVLDLQERCALGESRAGYESALASIGARWLGADARSVPRCAALIVPAAVEIPPPAVRAIATCLHAGARVLLESGAGFAVGADFRAHRAVLRDYLDVRLEAPVELWDTHAASRRTPYVDYTWPFPAKVRDFSRVVPLKRQPGEMIARADGLPVAMKRRSGRGTLIFLGSPLGPALWAGDAEARRWLRAVVYARG